MKYKGLRRRAIRRKNNTKKLEYIAPKKKIGGAPYSRTKEYKYFEGHITPEVAKQLSKKNVICWHNDRIMYLPSCAVKKFWQAQKHCKRCPLFQNDAHSEQLRSLIEEWQRDDLEEELDGD